MKIKLPEKQIKQLSALPEQGMGYQIIDIRLKNGRVLIGKTVFNSSYVQVDDNEEFDPNDILEIRLH